REQARGRHPRRPDRERGDRTGQVEADTAAGDRGRERGDTEADRQAEGEGGREDERAGGPGVGGRFAREPANGRHREHHKARERRRRKDHPPLGHLAPENRDETLHAARPFSSPTTARKISSSESGSAVAFSTPSTARNLSQDSSVKFDTTASMPQPRTLTRAASNASSSVPKAVRVSVRRLEYRIRRNLDLSASTSSSTTRRPFPRMPARVAIPSKPERSWVVTNTVVPRSASSPTISSKSARRATA